MPNALSMRRSNFAHLILPGSATASARIQIAAFGERMARKKVMCPALRSAGSNTPHFDPDGIGGLGLLAAAGRIVWGARRGPSWRWYAVRATQRSLWRRRSDRA
jgi:hypothetical protein